MKPKHTLAALVLLSAIVVLPAPARAQTDIAGLSIEDLLNTEITSVSRKEQTLSRAAAAVHVITAEDIRRSGATTLPEVLRLAPGFTVAQIDANAWAITARGFNGFVANKLLVLIDGRSVYSPMFSGVHWEMQSLPLTEIERIEVIRGTAGALWGANAVNGVINVITKRADETQGPAVSVGVGSTQDSLTQVRYGGRAGSRGYYRFFGGYSDRSANVSADGAGTLDDGRVALGGGRFDWRGDTDTFFVSALAQDSDFERQSSRISLTPPYSENAAAAGPLRESNVMFSWNRARSSRSDVGVQSFYQQYLHTQGGVVERWQIADVEGRQRQTIGRHELVFGAGYRMSRARTDNSPYVSFRNPHETKSLVTAFAQDEIELTSGIRVTPGAKFEHNEDTGFEWQPSLRGTWMPSRSQSVWASVSRAVRTPAKADFDLFVPSAVLPVPGPLTTILTVEGSHDFHAENVKALEAGYRWQRGIASLDVAAFRNDYDDLLAMFPMQPRVSSFLERPVLFVPLVFANGLSATTHGGEVAGVLRPASRLRVSGSYSLLKVRLGKLEEGAAVAPTQGSVPVHQYQVGTFVDLPKRTEISAMLRGASAMPDQSIAPDQSLDLRVAWRVAQRLELSVAAKNLFHDNVLEYADSASEGAVPRPVKTAVFAGLAWRF